MKRMNWFAKTSSVLAMGLFLSAPAAVFASGEDVRSHIIEEEMVFPVDSLQLSAVHTSNSDGDNSQTSLVFSIDGAAYRGPGGWRGGFGLLEYDVDLRLSLPEGDNNMIGIESAEFLVGHYGHDGDEVSIRANVIRLAYRERPGSELIERELEIEPLGMSVIQDIDLSEAVTLTLTFDAGAGLYFVDIEQEVPLANNQVDYIGFRTNLDTGLRFLNTVEVGGSLGYLGRVLDGYDHSTTVGEQNLVRLRQVELGAYTDVYLGPRRNYFLRADYTNTANYGFSESGQRRDAQHRGLIGVGGRFR